MGSGGSGAGAVLPGPPMSAPPPLPPIHVIPEQQILGRLHISSVGIHRICRTHQQWVFLLLRVGSWLKEATCGFSACVTGFPRSDVSVALSNSTALNDFPRPSHTPTTTTSLWRMEGNIEYSLKRLTERSYNSIHSRQEVVKCELIQCGLGARGEHQNDFPIEAVALICVDTQ